MLVTLLAGMLPAWPIGGLLPASALPASQRAKERVIIEVARGANPEQVARALGVVPTHVYSEVFQGFAAELPAAELPTAEPPAAASRAGDRQRGVLRIWPDLPVQTEAQELPTGVERISANHNEWAAILEDGGNIDADVAVLDTGIDNHPDLNVVDGVDCSGTDTGNWTDGQGHGTHVAGTIAAIDNTEGVVGVAPGARLWAVKVFDNSGNGLISEVICGLDWVYSNRATIDVVNMSLSAKAIREDKKPCGETTTPLHNAICQVVEGGVSVIVAAGNQGQNAAKRAPATYEEVITVSAFTDFDGEPGKKGKPTCSGGRDDRFSGFSNYGRDIDIAAPGVCILSTAPGGYKLMTGTSMATPHVTGAVALYLAEGPGPNTPSGARDWLLTQASQPQRSEFGFTGDPDRHHERVLYLPSA